MSFYLGGSRIIVTGWNGADGDIESWKAISQGGQEVQEGERARIVVVLDGVGCRAAQRTVLACYVEELKPVRTPTSGGTGVVRLRSRGGICVRARLIENNTNWWRAE